VGSYRNTKKLGGEKEMRVSSKLVGSLLFLTTIALLIVPVAYTTPPTEEIGTFDGSLPDTVEMWERGNNIIMHSYGGGGYLFGILEGKWIHDEWMVIHPTGIATVNGVWDTPEGVIFNGPGGPLVGTVHVRYSGKANVVTEEFHGRWVIISGTGDLANLRGHGAVWMDETGGHSTLQYHFDPS